MRNLILLIIAFLSIVSLTSCKKETLQSYLIEKQEAKNFVTFDFSTNMLPFQVAENATEDDKKAFKSLRKVNVAFLPQNKASKEEIEVEKTKLKSVLKSDDYKSLMKFKKKEGSMVIYYKGEPEKIDEMIVFGYGDDLGVGVARLLGDDMNPTALIQMMNSVDVNEQSDVFKKIKGVIKNNDKQETQKEKEEVKEE